ncbi:uncharacterized protein FLJ43738 [Menidia menidia]
MDTTAMRADPMANMSETSLDISQENCEAGARDQGQGVLISESMFVEHSLENSFASTDDVPAQTNDSSHYVTWTVYIAVAIPKADETDAPKASNKARRNDKSSSQVMVKTHKSQSCYHFEFTLLPGDAEKVKVDLIDFGPVAKIYRENETKILRTWYEGKKTWVGWAQDFNVRVNEATVINLLSQKIKLNIWNGNEELSNQARYERLKAIRLPQDESEYAADVYGGVKAMVKRMRNVCEGRSTTTKHKGDLFSGCSSERSPESDSNDLVNSQLLKTESCVPEDIKKISSALVEISPVNLVAGEISLTECFPLCSAGVLDIMCHISLDRPLLSEKLRSELNPLVITILSATSMPSTPVPFHILQETCMPVYCQYKFHHLKVHRTNPHKHSSNIYFRDVNVILTGLMSPKELHELFCGPPLEIEVHDRDLKPGDSLNSPATFDSGPDSDTDCSGELSEQKTPHAHTYGIASLNLSELLFGRRCFKALLPIKCSPSPVPMDWEQNRPKNKNVDTAVSRDHIRQGYYYDANSQLKVTVEIACPVVLKNGNGMDFCSTPFGRIVYLFGYSNSAVMKKLRAEILNINAAAFHLGQESLECIETALSNYVINFKHDESKDLDFVTGFHVLDKKTHIVVLEGLKDKAVKKLWKTVPMKLSENEDEQVIVLYNSKLSFFKRIYDSLHVGLSPICLCKSLETIMRNPLIYVRGMVPQPCFQALSRLSHLCHARQLEEAVQRNLFPSADMILSLSREYGTYAEMCELTDNTDTKQDSHRLSVKMKRQALLNTHNKEYLRWKHSQHTPLQQDFVQENIKYVQEESKRLQKREAATLMVEQSGSTVAHNYSIQTFNSNTRAMELLLQEMAQMPGRRFTYSQQYHSATVELAGLSSKTHSTPTAPSTAWVTHLRDSKGHAKRLHETRVEELKKPWRENVLHANTLEPTLSRDTWPWNQRSEDFQLYRKPPPFFSTTPITIHLAGN